MSNRTHTGLRFEILEGRLALTASAFGGLDIAVTNLQPVDPCFRLAPPLAANYGDPQGPSLDHLIGVVERQTFTDPCRFVSPVFVGLTPPGGGGIDGGGGLDGGGA